MPRQLRKWRQGAGGGRGRPAKKRAPPQRPVTLATLLRHLQIQVTIEILRMVGVPPSGTDVSGCRIVSEALLELSDSGLVPKALGLSEDTVTRIWKGRIWKEGAFEDVMRKLPEAIAERNGPFHTTAS